MSLDCFYQLAFAVQPTTPKCSGWKQVPFLDLAHDSQSGLAVLHIRAGSFDPCWTSVYIWTQLADNWQLDNLGWSPTYVWWLAWVPSQWSQGPESNKSRSHIAPRCLRLELIWRYFRHFPWVKASPKYSLDFKDKKIDAISWWEELKSTEPFLAICCTIDVCEVPSPYTPEKDTCSWKFMCSSCHLLWRNLGKNNLLATPELKIVFWRSPYQD